MARKNRTIEISDAAQEALDVVVKLDKMKQKDALSQLVEFFAALDRPARQLVMATLPPEYADDAADRLRDAALHRLAEANAPYTPPVRRARPDAPSGERGRRAS